MDVFDRAQEAELSAWRRLNEAPTVQVERRGRPPSRCECGGEIEPARRKALPGVRTCIECALALERGNRTLKRK